MRKYAESGTETNNFLSQRLNDDYLTSRVLPEQENIKRQRQNAGFGFSKCLFYRFKILVVLHVPKAIIRLLICC